MPFGLTNASATFQRALDISSAHYKWRTCLVHTGDIVVFLKLVKEHIAHMEDVLTVLSSAVIYFELRKSELFYDRIK